MPDRPGALSGGNTGRGRHATRCLAATAAIAMAPLGLPAAAAFQDPPAVVEPAPEADWPSATDVVEAYGRVRGWLDDFSLPTPRRTAAVVPIDGASAACIVVRRSGRVVGVGTAVGGDELMIRRAAGRAFGEVLTDDAIAALPETLRDDLGTRLTLELEVAGSPRPLLGRTASEMSSTYDPGLDAIAARRDDRWACALPSRLRARGRSVELGPIVRSLAAELELPPVDPDRLRAEHGLRVYRAATVHLAQAGPDRAPVQTIRGRMPLPTSAVTVRGIVSSADELARHVIGRLVQTPPGRPARALGFHGDYVPHLDAYEPLLATPFEQALLAFALATYAATPGVDAGLAARASATAREALLQLATVEPGEQDPTDDLSADAAVVLAAAALPDDAELAPVVGAARERIEHAADRAIREGDSGSPHAMALVAAALARDARRTAVAERGARAATLTRLAWSAASGPRAVGLLPWIVWAELDVAALSHEPVEHAMQLHAVRLIVDRLRVGWNALEGPPDLEGGLALSSATIAGGDVHRVDAQGLRPATGVAAMLGAPGLVDDAEAAAALGRHLSTVRFAMQLAVRPECRWSVPMPDRALGGIRAAPWDDRLPAAAQAMGLLMLSETLRGLGPRPD